MSGEASATKPTNGGSSGFGENVHISNHPVLSHKITIMRSSTTEPGTFRAALREVTYHLGYEATSRLTTQSVKISVPVPRKQESDGSIIMDHLEHSGFKLKERIALIPKIRSGLGMVDSMLELLPNAAIHHIGMYKVDGQHPVQYFNRLPRKCESDVAYILDPVISTSSTIVSLVSILKKVRVRYALVCD
jgi:uracil phosphoribosyltransferase